MTIGPLVPGSPTTVTPDLGHAGYASAQGPGPDFQYEADDILGVLQVALNVQASADRRLLRGSYAQMLALENVQAGWQFDADAYGRYVAANSFAYNGAPWVGVSTGTPGIVWVHLLTAHLVPNSNQGICRIGPMGTIDTSTPNARIPLTVVQRHVHHQSALARATLLSGALDAETGLFPELTLLGSSFAAEVGDQVVGSFGPLNLRNWGTSYAEIAISLLQDVDGTNGGPSSIILNRCRVGPANPAQPAVNPYVLVTPTLPFNKTVTRRGNAYIRFAAVAGNSTFDYEGMDATDFTLGSLTVFRP